MATKKRLDFNTILAIYAIRLHNRGDHDVFRRYGITKPTYYRHLRPIRAEIEEAYAKNTALSEWFVLEPPAAKFVEEKDPIISGTGAQLLPEAEDETAYQKVERTNENLKIQAKYDIEKAVEHIRSAWTCYKHLNDELQAASVLLTVGDLLHMSGIYAATSPPKGQPLHRPKTEYRETSVGVSNATGRKSATRQSATAEQGDLGRVPKAAEYLAQERGTEVVERTPPELVGVPRAIPKPDTSTPPPTNPDDPYSPLVVLDASKTAKEGSLFLTLRHPPHPEMGLFDAYLWALEEDTEDGTKPGDIPRLSDGVRATDILYLLFDLSKMGISMTYKNPAMGRPRGINQVGTNPVYQVPNGTLDCVNEASAKAARHALPTEVEARRLAKIRFSGEELHPDTVDEYESAREDWIDLMKEDLNAKDRSAPSMGRDKVAWPPKMVDLVNRWTNQQ